MDTTNLKRKLLQINALAFLKLIMNLIYLSNPSSAQKHHEAFEVPHFFQAYN